MNKIIGLTGIIGSGKSTVANLIKEKGFTVLDADKIAGKITNSNASVKEDIIAFLGVNSYTGGGFNRKYIAEIVFANFEKLQKLNDIIHPYVSEKFLLFSNKKKCKSDLIFWDVPLLFEGNMHKLCHKIIVVSCQDIIRIERLKSKRFFSKEEVRKREKYQIPLGEKEQLADYVIDNSLALQYTAKQLYEILNKLEQK